MAIKVDPLTGKPIFVNQLADESNPTLSNPLDPDGNYIGSSVGVDIASAGPLIIGVDGDYFSVTGTANFASMTVAANRKFTLQFDGVLTMTHNGTTLDLPGEANITTAAGDVASFQSTGANTVQCTDYTKADGTAVVVAGGGAVTLAGTWNASTNTPSLTDGSGTQGEYYRVTVAGTTSLDGIAVWAVDDWVVAEGSTWTKINNDGDITGPGSSTDNAIARFDSTTGKLLQDSGVTVDDSDNLVVPSCTTTKVLALAPDSDLAVTSAGQELPSANSHLEITPDADYVLTSTPSVAAPAVSDGQILIVHNLSGSFSVDLQDSSVLVGSTIILGGAEGSIKPGGAMTLHYSQTISMWVVLSNPNQAALGANADLLDVRNQSGSAIVAGRAVYLAGFSVGQNRPLVELADANDPTKMPAIGVTSVSIGNNSNGSIVSFGTLQNAVDTSTASIGDGVWIDQLNPGILVFDRPSIDDIQRIGTVSRSHASQGVMVVTGAGRTNDIPTQSIWPKGADIASASTLTLGADGHSFDVTGTTTIDEISSIGVGMVIILKFNDALTLTHDANDLILPGGVDIITAAGDVAMFTEYDDGDWRCTGYTKADGTAVVTASGGAWVIIGTSEASDVASLEVSGLDDTYDSYAIGITDITGADTVDAYLRVGPSGGADSGSSDYSYSNFAVSSVNRTDLSGGESFIPLNSLADNVGNTGGRGLGAMLFLHRPADGVTFPQISGTSRLRNGGTTDHTVLVGGTRLSVIDLNIVQVLMASGNITGRLTVWGISHV